MEFEFINGIMLGFEFPDLSDLPEEMRPRGAFILDLLIIRLAFIW